MKYRSEIDGLRALAILPVVFFHAGFGFFQGGFVGVDIFFVISGYLITTIILTESENKKFSYINFYERRARRIMPALYLVMFFSIIAAWLLLFPADFKYFSESLVATSLFSSNILFMLKSGYWGSANELVPLLHTWSLAVEEQYYIFFPIFLLAMWNFRKRWILSALIIIALISLLLSVWMAEAKPTANFFLIFTRAWELAIGASISFYFVYRKNTMKTILNNRYIDEILGLTGILLIVYAVLFFNDSTPFPSFYALIPTIGAALIIVFTSHSTLVGKFLGSKPLVGIGLLSYSTYLWHQPIFAFSRHAAIDTLSTEIYLALILLTVTLSYISWKYIESPFRNRKIISRKFIFSFTIIGGLLFIAFGITGHMNNGFKQRTTLSGLPFDGLDAPLDPNHGLGSNCNLTNQCKTSNHPKVLLWGDSFAKHLAGGLQYSSTALNFQQVTSDSCRPVLDISIVGSFGNGTLVRTKKWAQECVSHNNSIFDYIKSNKDIEYIILASPFAFTKKIYTKDSTKDYSDDLVFKYFRDMVEKLRSIGKKPIFIAPPPNNWKDIGRCSIKSMALGMNPNTCDFDSNSYSEYTRNAYTIMQAVEKFAPVVKMEDFICENGTCDVIMDDVVLYRDTYHLTKRGSEYLGVKYDLMGKIISSADQYWSQKETTKNSK